MGTGAATADRRQSARRLTLVVLCAADMLVALDGTIVNVALPSIQVDLGLSAAALQWVVTAYTLTLGSFLLLGGRIGDALGRRRTLLIGLATFTAASALAGAAREPALLLASRALAGLGAALAIPAALALVAATFAEGRERNRALGAMSASIDVGMVAGALLGGAVTSLLGWPWVFFVIVLLGLVTLLALPRAGVADRRPPRRGRPLGAPAALTAAAGLAMLILGLSRAPGHGLGAAVGPLAAAAAFLAGFVVLERRSPSPLLPPRLLRRRRACGAYLAIVANAGAFVCLVVLSTLYMQRVLHLSALEAGLAFVPLAVSAGAGGPLAPWLVDRAGARRVVVLSLLVTAACVGWLSRIPMHGDYAATLLPVFAVSGLTFATAAVPLTGEAVAEAPPDDQGIAAGLFQTFTHAGGAVVLALVVIAGAARSDAALRAGAAPLEAATAGHRLGFVLVSALLVAGAIAAAVLLPRVGLETRRLRDRAAGNDPCDA
jgi:EmrB/QacA subfamily drug resistance transporter